MLYFALMDEKKLYLFELASFLDSHSMKMSGEELAQHLNRNEILTSYGTEYQGGRGTYAFIRHSYETFREAGLQTAADRIARVFVKPDGSYAYED